MPLAFPANEKKIADALQDALRATMQTGFDVDINLGKWAHKDAASCSNAAITCSVQLYNGDKIEGSFLLLFHAAFIKMILEKLSAPVDDDFMRDTAEEIANMVFGMMKANLNAKGDAYQPAFPQSLRKGEPVSPNSNAECIGLPFYTGSYENEALLSVVRYQ